MAHLFCTNFAATALGSHVDFNLFTGLEEITPWMDAGCSPSHPKQYVWESRGLFLLLVLVLLLKKKRLKDCQDFFCLFAFTTSGLVGR